MKIPVESSVARIRWMPLVVQTNTGMVHIRDAYGSSRPLCGSDGHEQYRETALISGSKYEVSCVRCKNSLNARKKASERKIQAMEADIGRLRACIERDEFFDNYIGDVSQVKRAEPKVSKAQVARDLIDSMGVEPSVQWDDKGVFDMLGMENPARQIRLIQAYVNAKNYPPSPSPTYDKIKDYEVIDFDDED